MAVITRHKYATAHNNAAYLRQIGDILTPSNCYDRTIYSYDAVDETTPAPLTAGVFSYKNSALPTDPINSYKQRFLAGRVSRTVRIDDNTEGIVAATWYSYDYRGRLEWVIQYINGLGYKTIDYTYDDFTSNLLSVNYQKYVIADQHAFYYTYDCNNRLINTTSSVKNSAKQHEASYSFYKHGPVKRIELAKTGTTPMQGIDYTYTITGALKTINDPSLTQAKDPGNDANDAFGMQLNYYANDYVCRNKNNATANNPAMVIAGYFTNLGATIPVKNYFNGNIFQNLSKTKSSALATTNSYMYDYDYHNWMKKANFGYIITTSVNTTINTGEYNETGSNPNGIQYDLNGNILQLSRTAYTNPTTSSNAMDNLSYTYYPNSNKLRRVEDADGNKGLGDLGNQTAIDNYQYNKMGQLIGNTQESQGFEYNSYGKTKGIGGSVIIGGIKYKPNIRFYYDAQGFRTKKVESRPNPAIPYAYFTFTTYYVNDVRGNTVAVYSTTGKEMPIYANERIGSIKDNGTTVNYEYELNDHLGNVRVVIPRNAPTTFSTFANYYPYGMNMPSNTGTNEWQKHSLNPTYYRYGYQGQFAEKDQETALYSFEARMYDPRIGRWLTIDPAREFHSPYLAMGNNPVIYNDPNGEFLQIFLYWFLRRKVLPALAVALNETGKEYVGNLLVELFFPGEENQIVDKGTFIQGMRTFGATFIKELVSFKLNKNQKLIANLVDAGSDAFVGTNLLLADEESKGRKYSNTQKVVFFISSFLLEFASASATDDKILKKLGGDDNQYYVKQLYSVMIEFFKNDLNAITNLISSWGRMGPRYEERKIPKLNLKCNCYKF